MLDCTLSWHLVGYGATAVLACSILWCQSCQATRTLARMAVLENFLTTKEEADPLKYVVFDNLLSKLVCPELLNTATAAFVFLEGASSHLSIFPPRTSTVQLVSNSTTHCTVWPFFVLQAVVYCGRNGFLPHNGFSTRFP